MVWTHFEISLTGFLFICVWLAHGSVNLSMRIYSLSLIEICKYSFHCQCVIQNMFKMIV